MDNFNEKFNKEDKSSSKFPSAKKGSGKDIDFNTFLSALSSTKVPEKEPPPSPKKVHEKENIEPIRAEDEKVLWEAGTTKADESRETFSIKKGEFDPYNLPQPEKDFWKETDSPLENAKPEKGIWEDEAEEKKTRKKEKEVKPYSFLRREQSSFEPVKYEVKNEEEKLEEVSVFETLPQEKPPASEEEIKTEEAPPWLKEGAIETEPPSFEKALEEKTVKSTVKETVSGIPARTPAVETPWLTGKPKMPEAPVFETPDFRARRKDQYTLHDLFKIMLGKQASDLHISVGNVPILRINGDLAVTDYPVLTESKVEELLFSLPNEEQLYHFEETGDLDFAYAMPGVARFRCNYYQDYRGIAGAFRLIPSKIPVLDELNLPSIIKDIAQFRKGLIIVTGPTGSGKSTTLAAIINTINNSRNAHIVTIEDPLEFVHESRMCLITHREVGTNASSFASALRAAIREDPDIILVGEMRDLETMALAIRAASTGLLVLTTLHTNNASKAVDRIIDVFPAIQQDQIRAMLSDSLKAVVAQQLIKTADKKGRCAAVEILIATLGLSNIVREAKTPQIPSIIQTGREFGMQSMDQALIELIRAGKITAKVAKDRASDYKTFLRAGIDLEAE